MSIVRSAVVSPEVTLDLGPAALPEAQGVSRCASGFMTDRSVLR
jgi:hypothetical protein